MRVTETNGSVQLPMDLVGILEGEENEYLIFEFCGEEIVVVTRVGDNFSGTSRP